MDDKLGVHEEEGVALGLPRRLNHFLLFFIAELREIIDHFHSVSSIRDAETEFELKGLDATAAEVVALNHQKVWDRLITHGELQL